MVCQKSTLNENKPDSREVKQNRAKGKTMSENESSNFDSTTPTTVDQCALFKNAAWGKVFLEFADFKRNLIPYTLQIAFGIGLLVCWGFCICGFFGEGPLIGYPFFETVGNNKEIGVVCKIICLRTIGCLIVFTTSPFVVHYALEVAKCLFVKVAVPLWDKLVIRFLVDVLPELAPFLLERFMRLIDITLAGLISIIVTVSAVLKGIVWLPKSLCQCLGKWCNKTEK